MGSAGFKYLIDLEAASMWLVQEADSTYPHDFDVSFVVSDLLAHPQFVIVVIQASGQYLRFIQVVDLLWGEGLTYDCFSYHGVENLVYHKGKLLGSINGSKVANWSLYRLKAPLRRYARILDILWGTSFYLWCLAYWAAPELLGSHCDLDLGTSHSLPMLADTSLLPPWNLPWSE